MREPEHIDPDPKPDPAAAPAPRIYVDPHEALSGPPGRTIVNFGPGVTGATVLGWDRDHKEISVAEVRTFPDLWFRLKDLTPNGEILLEQYIRTGAL